MVAPDYGQIGPLTRFDTTDPALQGKGSLGSYVTAPGGWTAGQKSSKYSCCSHAVGASAACSAVISLSSRNFS